MSTPSATNCWGHCSKLFKRHHRRQSALYRARTRRRGQSRGRCHGIQPRTPANRIIVDALWNDGEDDAENIAWAHEAGAALQPFATGTSYLNYVADTRRRDVRRGYTEEKYRRLLL